MLLHWDGYRVREPSGIWYGGKGLPVATIARPGLQYTINPLGIMSISGFIIESLGVYVCKIRT